MGSPLAGQTRSCLSRRQPVLEFPNSASRISGRGGGQRNMSRDEDTVARLGSLSMGSLRVTMQLFWRAFNKCECSITIYLALVVEMWKIAENVNQIGRAKLRRLKDSNLRASPGLWILKLRLNTDISFHCWNVHYVLFSFSPMPPRTLKINPAPFRYSQPPVLNSLGNKPPQAKQVHYFPDIVLLTH